MKARLQEAFNKHVSPRIPTTLKATARLQGFGLWKIPLLFSVRPKVKELSETRAVVEIPLTRFTRNHLGSMYFGSLAIGADCVVGLFATHLMGKRHRDVQLSFKSFQAEFLKRPEGDVYFICEEGKQIEKFVKEILASGHRGNLPVNAYAVVKDDPDTIIAKFTLTLSLKRKIK